MRRLILIALASAFAIAVAHISPAVEVAAKKTPLGFSMSEFKTMIKQALGNYADAFGPEKDLRSGAIAEVPGAYFYRFANATIGLVSGGVSMIMMLAYFLREQVLLWHAADRGRKIGPEIGEVTFVDAVAICPKVNPLGFVWKPGG